METIGKPGDGQLSPDSVDGDVEECAYCYYMVPSMSEDERPPKSNDDDAWAKLALDHADDCEWILTRAHRINLG